MLASKADYWIIEGREKYLARELDAERSSKSD
jgi:hypothetical protein